MCLLQQSHVDLCGSLAAAAIMAAERGPGQLYFLSCNVILPELRLFYQVLLPEVWVEVGLW